MSQHLIYCFSGSGNALSIARTLARSLGDADLVSMRKPPVVTDATKADTVGFVFPCHGGGLPGKVEEYVRDLRIGENTYTYGIVTYAVSPGAGLAQLDRIIPLRYQTGIPHYNSCVWLASPDFAMKDTDAVAAEKQAQAMARKAAQNVKKRIEGKDESAVVPIDEVASRLWRSLQVRKSRRMTVDSEKCTGCGICASLCPQGNFEIYGGKSHMGQNCIGCLSCLQFCPTAAIDAGRFSRKRTRYHNPHVEAAELSEGLLHFDKPVRKKAEKPEKVDKSE